MFNLGERLNHFMFRWMHSNHLIYNTCWEDPKLDHEAMQLNSDSQVMVITSAGCNALDYAIANPKRIHAVDVNPKQGALLELKMAGIRALAFEEFFQIFGTGKCKAFPILYKEKLRSQLSTTAREYWDKNRDFFSGADTYESFYYRGTSGAFAQWLNHYIDFNRLREPIVASFSAATLKEQQQIYWEFLHEGFWSKTLRWIINKDFALALLGVPRAQRKQVDAKYAGGMAEFIEQCIVAVFTKLSLKDNYFWWLYLNGEYTKDRCPRYLQEKYFTQLKSGAVDRIEVHTNTVEKFLSKTKDPISHFVLLDHMDWFEAHDRLSLQREWKQILRASTKGTQVLWRSARPDGKFVNSIPVKVKGKQTHLADVLKYDTKLANKLHQRDRVHTYSSFSVASVAGL